MKIICPKCQYENQADSTRVVCARCATIIEVKQDQGLGSDTNGKRQTARLPFVGNVGNSQPLPPPPNNQAANSNLPNMPNLDAYATRVGDEFDDVLDIPRQTPSGYQPGNEPTTAFEDVFTMPNYNSPPSYDFPPQEKKPTAPIEGFPTGQNRQQRPTQDYGNAPEPEFMGWPVLPENADDDQEQIGGFSSNRGALLARVALGVVVFGLLSFLAYYFLGDKIAKRQGELGGVTKDNTANGATGAAPTYPPATVPSLENKPAELKPTTPDNSKSASNSAPGTAQQPASGSTAQQATGGSQTQTPSQSKDRVVIPPIEGKSAHSKPAPPPTAATAPPTPKNGNLTIQVASFNDQAQANDRVSRLHQAKVDARIVQAEVGGKTWYRVQIGGFKSREEASKYASQLKAQGAVQDFIITTIVK